MGDFGDDDFLFFGLILSTLEHRGWREGPFHSFFSFFLSSDFTNGTECGRFFAALGYSSSGMTVSFIAEERLGRSSWSFPHRSFESDGGFYRGLLARPARFFSSPKILLPFLPWERRGGEEGREMSAYGG